MSLQEKNIKLEEYNKIIKESDEVDKSIQSLTIDIETLKQRLDILEENLKQQQKKKKGLDKSLPKARKFIEEYQENKKYEKTVIPYIRNCIDYILQQKSIWKNKQYEIFELFETYDEFHISQSFKNWFEEINEHTINNYHNDERIVWLAHTIRIIQLDVKILKLITSGFTYENEIGIDLYKKLGFEIPSRQIQSIYEQEQEEECQDECHYEGRRTREWENMKKFRSYFM